MTRWVHEEDETRDHPPLPGGEEVLWQGSPAVWPLARDAFHVRKLAIYFGLLAAWGVASGMADQLPGSEIAAVVGRLALVAALGLALVSFLAWRTARATTYLVTRKRVVLRIGIALPMTINIPLASIESVRVKVGRDGSGDVALALAPGAHLAWLHLWPHARPWALRHPEPSFRAIPDARVAATRLAAAIDPTGQGSQPADPVRPATAPTPTLVQALS